MNTDKNRKILQTIKMTKNEIVNLCTAEQINPYAYSQILTGPVPISIFRTLLGVFIDLYQSWML